jgi:hypothetical protein
VRRRAPALAAVPALLLVACTGDGTDSGTEPATAAPQGTSPACAQVVAAVPATVLDLPRIAAGEPPPGVLEFGSPPVTVRCGLAPTGPTTLPCIAVDGVDWVVDDPGEGSPDPVRFLTYGRTPAVEVVVPAEYGRGTATGALVDLVTAVSLLPQDRSCVG